MATSANKPEHELIKNAMSKKKSSVSPGVLVLNNVFPFHFNKYNRKKDTAYYECASRSRTFCNARAVLSKLEIEGESGRHILSSFTKANIIKACKSKIVWRSKLQPLKKN